MKYLILLLFVGCVQEKFTQDDAHCIEAYGKATKAERVQIYMDCVEKIPGTQITVIEK